jgi:DNA-binding beta-propeller fold protein YncE
MRVARLVAAAGASACLIAGAALSAPAALAHIHHNSSSFIGRFSHTRLIASTVPANGDINPYGVAVVRHSRGRLHRGDILVSNFNDKANQQGTGTTIMELSRGGQVTQFAHISASALPGACPGGIGLTTALVVVHGWVIVGSLPSKDGSVATSGPGCLLVLDSQGRVRETIHGINGPWDMTAISAGPFAVLFVANVLNHTKAANGAVTRHGTILRLALRFAHRGVPVLGDVTRIGSGFSEQSNSTTFVVGPTGLGFARNGSLYVADTGKNRITAIPDALFRDESAGTGIVLTSGGALNSPLGLAIAPNGDVLTVNGGDGKVVETTRAGAQVAMMLLDNSGTPPGNGALFGLAVAPHGAGLYYVDDAANTLRLLH